MKVSLFRLVCVSGALCITTACVEPPPTSTPSNNTSQDQGGTTEEMGALPDDMTKSEQDMSSSREDMSDTSDMPVTPTEDMGCGCVNREVCNPDEGNICVACYVNADNESVNCDNDEEPACLNSDAESRCVQCTGDVHCADNEEGHTQCNTETNKCVQCLDDMHCVNERCNPDTNMCVSCLETRDCDLGEVCSKDSFECVGCDGAGSDQSDRDNVCQQAYENFQPPLNYCESDSCVECTENTHCSAPNKMNAFFVCDTTTYTCTDTPVDSKKVGETCNYDDECISSGTHDAACVELSESNKTRCLYEKPTGPMASCPKIWLIPSSEQFVSQANDTPRTFCLPDLANTSFEAVLNAIEKTPCTMVGMQDICGTNGSCQTYPIDGKNQCSYLCDGSIMDPATRNKQCPGTCRLVGHASEQIHYCL